MDRSSKPLADLTAYETELIRRKAAALVRRRHVPPGDADDLRQDLALVVLMARESRGTPLDEALAGVVVRRGAARLLRDRRAAKRHGGPLAPLPEDVPDLAGADTRADASDVVDALDRLPERLRAVVEAVRTGTVTGAAKRLGVSRSTVYARLQEIRQRPEFRSFRPTGGGTETSEHP